MTAAQIIFLGLSALIFFGFGGFCLVSLREGERRAASISLSLALGGGLVLAVIAFLPQIVQLGLLIVFGLGVILGLIASWLTPTRVDLSHDIPHERVDERDIMFARARLTPGSPEYSDYYQHNPQNKRKDDLTRAKPGLLSLNAELADRLLFTSPQASFTLTEALHTVVDGVVALEPLRVNPNVITAYLKSLARYYGALQVGVTRVQPYHYYSHIGRGSGRYGAPISIEHRYAIAFSVEMDHTMIRSNPTAAGVMESARQYVEAARVAVQLAAVIRNMGYPARAHIDGDYRVICPLVGRDAGLGEIGRMGLLMTPYQGPRVRLGVVTTNLELIPDNPTRNSSVIDFCTRCKKCALNCPVQAIPYGERKMIAGALRWRIDADTCFRYWNVIGTDCGRCMAVCPYSHPANLYHNLVRWGIAHSAAFRQMALWLDDLFYWKRPEIKSPPIWIRLAGREKEKE